MSYSEWRGTRSGARVWRATSEGETQLVLPDAALDLMWFDGNVIVAGPDTSAVSFDSSPGKSTWGLRLPPGVAHAVFGVSVRELAGLRVPLDDIVGRQASPPTFSADIGGDLETTLLSLYACAEPGRSRLELARAVDEAARVGSGARAAAESLGLSERTLRRWSEQWFGYGYKTLAQIHRFQRALRAAESGASLAAAASTAGYADQAHFTRECRRFSGMTPTALINAG